ncbi:MAG: hypothetical protein IT374_16035 [Polyangiaceae bacterium]|nr:hypothetical protein [Polyangiaceae bacterium]
MVSVAFTAACGGSSDDAATPPAGAAGAGGGAAGSSSGGKAGSPTAGSGGSTTAGKGGSTAAGAGGGIAGAAGVGGGKAGAGGDAGGAAGAGGSKAGAGGSASGAGGNAGKAGAGGAGQCQIDSDCDAKVPATTPAGCAQAFCEGGACRFRARDVDGDGHRAAKCVSATPSSVIEVGGDCNDAEATVSPDGWDGPKGDGHPDRCDGVDQDCSGTNDDQKLTNGATCTCTPGDVASCSELSNGQPVAFPGGKPVGACKAGSKTCGSDGKWGPCGGTVGPITESCNSLDDDCDGSTDEGTPADAPYWSYDGDDDLFAAKGYKKVQACVVPTKPPEECPTCDPAKWKLGNLPSTDCDDTKLEVNPISIEVCNGIDDDCDGAIDDADPSVTGQVVRYYDADDDNHGDKSLAGIKSCSAPVAPPACPSCDPAKWKTALPNDDCDDSVASVFPGATEICDGYDNNCNGGVDENAADDATWFYDADGDNHGDASMGSKTQCANPGLDVANCGPGAVAACPGRWKTNLVADDCDDGDGARYPGKAEVCDGKDNDCNSQVDDNAASTPQWSYDEDGDSHAPQGSAALTQCDNPGNSVTNCPGASVPCPERWKPAVLPPTDCNDKDGTTFPAAWDGPASTPRAYGVKPPGWSGYYFFNTTTGIPASNGGATQTLTSVNVVDLSFGTGGVSTAVGRDGFATRYEGTLVVETAGDHTFTLVLTDAAARVRVDGATVIDQFGAQATGEFASGATTLTAGEHAIVVEAYDVAGAFGLRLDWQSASFSRRPVDRVWNPGIGAQPNRCGGDQNCNATPDDSLVVDGDLTLSCGSVCEPGSFRPCGSAVGECKEGVQQCTSAGVWDSTCTGDVTSTTETCDAKDNDCDGQVDNGITCNCTDGNTQQCGVCLDGSQTCAGGQWSACTVPDSRVEHCKDYDGDTYCLLSGCTMYCTNASAPAAQKPPAGQGWKPKSSCAATSTTDCNDTSGAARPGGFNEEGASGATAGYCDNLDNDCDGVVDGGNACIDRVCVAPGNPDIQLWPLSLDRGDSDFSSNGPNVVISARYQIFAAGLLMSAPKVTMTETKSDWTTGHYNGTDLVSWVTDSRKFVASTGWNIPTGCAGSLSDFTCTETYTDTSSGNMDSGYVNEGLRYSCVGQTSGGDICTADPAQLSCSGCTLQMSCITKVRVLP